MMELARKYHFKHKQICRDKPSRFSATPHITPYFYIAPSHKRRCHRGVNIASYDKGRFYIPFIPLLSFYIAPGSPLHFSAVYQYKNSRNILTRVLWNNLSILNIQSDKRCLKGLLNDY